MSALLAKRKEPTHTPPILELNPPPVSRLLLWILTPLAEGSARGNQCNFTYTPAQFLALQELLRQTCVGNTQVPRTDTTQAPSDRSYHTTPNRSSESSVTSGDIDLEAIIKRLPFQSMHKKPGQRDLLSKVEITSAGNSSIMEIPTEDNAAGGRQDENKGHQDATVTMECSPDDPPPSNECDRTLVAKTFS